METGRSASAHDRRPMTEGGLGQQRASLILPRGAECSAENGRAATVLPAPSRMGNGLGKVLIWRAGISKSANGRMRPYGVSIPLDGVVPQTGPNRVEHGASPHCCGGVCGMVSEVRL